MSGTHEENPSAKHKIRRKFAGITCEKAAEYAKRWVFLVIGLFVMSFGVGLSIKASLGTSPISGIPYVLNLITGMSVGTTTIIVNVAIVLVQFLILRRKFRLSQLLQIPVCVIFGLLNDFALSCMDAIAPAEYWQQWLICLAGILLVGFGVSCEVTASVATLPGEGLVLTMCKVLPKIKFSYMKVAVDCMLVIIAAVLSLAFMQGLYGVREGTVAAAVLVGLSSKVFNRFVQPFGRRIFSAHPFAARPRIIYVRLPRSAA